MMESGNIGVMEYWSRGVLRDLLARIVSSASGALMVDFALRGLQMARPPLIVGKGQVNDSDESQTRRGEVYLSERQKRELASSDKLMVLTGTKSWRKNIE